MKWISGFSLRLKVLILVESMLLVLAAMSIVQVYNLKETQEKMSAKSLKSYAVNLGTPIGKSFRIRYNQVQSLAMNTVFEGMDKSKISDALTKFAELNDGYDIIVFVGKDGKLIAANTRNSSGYEVATDKLKDFPFQSVEWFRKSIQEEFSDDEDKLLMGTYVSTIGEDKVRTSVHGDSKYGSGFSTVVKNSENEVIGVLSTRLGMGWIEEAFSEMYSTLSNDGYLSSEIILINRQSQRVVTLHPEINNGERKFDYSTTGEETYPGFDDIMKSIHSGMAGFTMKVIEAHRDKHEHVIGYSSLDFDVVSTLGWGVLVIVDSSELIGGLEASINFFYLAVFGILVLSMIVSWFSVRKISGSLVLMVERLKERVENSMETSAKLSTVSDDLESGSVHQAAAVQETVASMTEMTSMINQTAKHVEESEELALEVNSRTRKGAEIMSNMVRSMESIQQANEELHEMTKIIEEISDKTKVINDIVFKTQLLSFNASIEAARAGQHGRGFAVVAEEVGNLAQMSGNAANEISTLLNKSISQVEQIVNSTKERVSEGQSVSGKAMETFSEIAEEVELITTKIKSIQDATREQEEGVKQVSVTMKQIDETTQANSNLASSASEYSDSVKEEANKLEDIMKKVTRIVLGGDSQLAFDEEKASGSKRAKGIVGSLVGKVKHGKASVSKEEDSFNSDDDSFKRVS